MKLNLHIIQEDLTPLVFKGRLYNEPTFCTCSYVIPYVLGSPFLEQALYLASADELPEIPQYEGNPSLVCIGVPPASYLKEPFNTIYSDENLSVSELLLTLAEIFQRYRQWEGQLQEIVDKDMPLKELGDISQPIIGNPICCQGRSLKNVFHVDANIEGMDSEKYRLYCEDFGTTKLPLEDNSYPSLESINELISDKAYIEAMHSMRPVIYGGDNYHFRTLYYNIGDDRGKTAHIYFNEIHHPFTDRDYALIKILGDYVAKALHGRDVESLNNPTDFEQVLNSLLRHHLIDESVILSALETLHWSNDDAYLCMVLESKSFDRDSKILKSLADQLTYQLPSECYTVLDGYLVFVFNLDKSNFGKEMLLAFVVPLLRDSLFIGGISMNFTDFKNLYYYYLQAKSALAIGRKENPTFWYFRYEDYLLKDMVSRCKGKRISETFCSQGLRILLDYDAEKGTDYTELLKTYLSLNMNVAATKRALFMHRNTCQYRLDRIVELTRLDLDDPDVRLELAIAFKIMELD